MKPSHLLAVLSATILGISTGLATPDRILSIDEILLGANEESYIVLRNVDDNLGSHYSSRRKTLLIEASATDNKVLKETLLTDITENRDVNHTDPHTQPKITREVHSQDQTLVLGELLTRYPTITPIPTNPDLLARLNINRFGIRFDTRIILIDRMPLRDKLPEAFLKDSVWKITEGRELGGAIYLKILTNSHDGDEADKIHQWICLNPHLTRQVRALKSLEPISLSLGSFATREEAIAQAVIWNKEAAQAKVSIDFQIWSRELTAGQIDYLVIAGSRTEELLSGGWDKKIETALDLNLRAVSSDRFREWFPIPQQ
jgi:hypothetical protein